MELKFISVKFQVAVYRLHIIFGKVLQGTLFKILENFLRGITAFSFTQEAITLLKGLGLVS